MDKDRAGFTRGTKTGNTDVGVESPDGTHSPGSPVWTPSIAPVAALGARLPEPAWLQGLQSALRPGGVVNTIVQRIQQAAEAATPIATELEKTAHLIGNSIARTEGVWRKIAEDIGTVAKSLQAYPSTVREALVLMSRLGWYLDREMGMGAPLRFKSAVDAGRATDAEWKMIAHFEQRADGICAELTEKYPHRSELFQAAFNAHRNGQYILSIPVMLAQVDGICLDVAKAHFFMGRDREKVIAHVVKLLNLQVQKSQGRSLLHSNPTCP
ncbi:hypothetical protein [Paraburkholderia phenoliruptrix]|uniref:hypothetical protein n=1 Tax=Paraburkholderia phenoliruptrix TaxID=252970 RepID=UPI002869C2E5|nr:hypothetical protein [Paraburkholderia phenoliruptrix]WMY11099.1 hypothetical protein P3F88_31065 [Paraburkholderia phenoliruptrix]